jgi:UDP-N-acetylmuramate dehydrogenase
MPAVPLSQWTTLGVGGPAHDFVDVPDVATLAEVLARAKADGHPVLVLGRGSNVVVADDGFPGTVAHITMMGVRYQPEGDRVVVAVAAGEDWSNLVERWVGDGLAGVECLSGIPGLAGATPVQNVGAYGQEVAHVLLSVGAWDRHKAEPVVLDRQQCGFSYRDSVFKATARYVVTEVRLSLERTQLSGPIAYPELAGRLGVAVGQRAPLQDAAQAVMDLRRSKGMVLDDADPDSRSAGSFFMNPVLSEAQLSELVQVAPGAPGFRGPAGTKVPAAWLVENAGFHKGYSNGGAAISSKHALALTVRPGGTTSDLLALAREVRNGVKARFGIALEVEPLLVGAYL